MYLYTFAHHATATLNGKKLEIISANNLEYLVFEVFDLSKNSNEGIKANSYLTDNNKVYRVKEVDINTNELVLEKEVRKLSEIESAQIGFRPPAFSATDIITKEIVSLEKYRGKYVFLDLFTTWCGPCIKELPEIKKVYDQVDRSKIEFIGIIGEDKPERIAQIISNSGLNWRLIEANRNNIIFNKYKVSSFPTTLLIDPNGIIIKNGLRSEELKRFIDNGFKETTVKDVKL
jgi:thiol-disulfide isomerase/thioredoxin